MKKKIALLMAVVMLFGVVVGGTFAWLSAGTKMVRNTFEVGNVSIELLEAKVDKYGEPLDKDGSVDEDGENLADRVKENLYKLIPGHTYTKDPEVTVIEGSEPSWVFIKVVNELSAIMPKDHLEKQILANGWTALNGQTGVYYKENVDAREEEQVLPVFEEITLNEDAAVADYASKVITVDAYAVQADGLNTVELAWNTLNNAWGE